LAPTGVCSKHSEASQVQEPLRAELGRRSADGKKFCMRRGIAQGKRAVGGAGQNLAGGSYDHRTTRHLAEIAGLLSLGERKLHRPHGLAAWPRLCELRYHGRQGAREERRASSGAEGPEVSRATTTTTPSPGAR